MATANVLSAQSIASLIAQSLPPDASPQLKNPYDGVAIAVHAAMIAVGFRLIGLTEDDRLPQSDKPARTLPDNWNQHSPSSHSFKYAHGQSSMEFLIKINRMGNKAVVMGMGIGDDKTNSFDVKIDEYISPSSLPSSPTKDDLTPTSSNTTAAPERSSDDLPETSKAIRDKTIEIYISAGRLSDFGALTRINLIQKLLPSLYKPGYEETPSSSRNATDTSSRTNEGRPQRPGPEEQPSPARPHPLHDPLAMPPRRPGVAPGEFAPPGFEDEYDMTRPPRPYPPGTVGGGGYGIGHRDLYPQGLGPNDPFRNIGPGLGGPGGGMGGGMHPDFNDPLFTGQGRGGGAQDPFGYDAQAPPGARYDPVGPGGAPRGSGGGGRFPGGGMGGSGGRPHNPFGDFGGGDFI